MFLVIFKSNLLISFNFIIHFLLSNSLLNILPKYRQILSMYWANTRDIPNHINVRNHRSSIGIKLFIHKWLGVKPQSTGNKISLSQFTRKTKWMSNLVSSANRIHLIFLLKIEDPLYGSDVCYNIYNIFQSKTGQKIHEIISTMPYCTR